MTSAKHQKCSNVHLYGTSILVHIFIFSPHLICVDLLYNEFVKLNLVPYFKLMPINCIWRHLTVQKQNDYNEMSGLKN